jgi:ribosomal protein S18 acetylase RimI-like enzyme
MSFTVRPLEIDDFNAFLDIQRDALLHAPEVFGSDYDWFDALSILSKEQRFERYMNFPYQYLLSAFAEDGSLMGMIGFSSDHTLAKTRHKGKVWGMYVKPDCRGQGIASALVESVLLTAQEIGCELIQLSVGTRNEASYSLYLRMGFTVYGTEAHAMKIGDDYVDEYLMVKFFR